MKTHRKGEGTMYKHILIPTDGSPLSEVAIKQGLQLAKTVNAKVTVVTTVPPFHVVAVEPTMVTDTREQYDKDVMRIAEARLAFPREAAKVAGVAYEDVPMIAEHPWAAIVETAKTRGCDLIVMASHGRKGVSALLLGSETTKVLTHTMIPTLVCR
jgi:nucleotide-binding universal stress UspA family protein